MPCRRGPGVGTMAVFDSGLGSLSVIRAVRRAGRARIVYLADQASYPYGLKPRAELDAAVRSAIRALRERFSPDVIVVASNTPGLALDVRGRGIITMRPPLAAALASSPSGRVGILGTRAALRSRGLSRLVAGVRGAGPRSFMRVDGSGLVDLVESGRFLSDPGGCRAGIRRALGRAARSVDTVVLSSTHLPFLLPLLEAEFPRIRFVDPADGVARRALRAAGPEPRRGSLRIFTTGDPAGMRRALAGLGIRNRVSAFR